MGSKLKNGLKNKKWATDACGPNFWEGAKLHPHSSFLGPGNCPKAGPSSVYTTLMQMRGEGAGSVYKHVSWNSIFYTNPSIPYLS